MSCHHADQKMGQLGHSDAKMRPEHVIRARYDADLVEGTRVLTCCNIDLLGWSAP